MLINVDFNSYFGQYAFYVWSSFLITFGLLAVLWLISIIERNKILRYAKRLQNSQAMKTKWQQPCARIQVLSHPLC